MRSRVLGFLLVALVTSCGGVEQGGENSRSAELPSTSPLQVSVWYPANGANLAPNTWVTLSSGVTGGTVSKFQYLINGTPFCTVTAAPYNCSYLTPASGSFTLQAIATDTYGGTSSQSVSYTVGAASSPPGSLPGWNLVWSDEFNGPDGSAVDPTKWVYGGTDDGKWNQELEYYNPSTDNVFVAGGNLHIVAKALPSGGGGFTCWYGPCQYTSGKIMTKAWGQPSLYEKKFGRFSARIKIPAGQGMWPAFWMLGNNMEAVSWPACGEIDVMENIGKTPATDYGTVHASSASQQEASLGGTTTLAMGALADSFHVYTVEWKAGEIRFLLDDTLFYTATSAQFQGNWVFDDHPFFLLLNLAIGGGWPGSPDASTTFPAEMLVDWVRVYDPAP